MRRRALIFGWDGVINVDTGYLHRIENCVFIERIVEMVQAFHEHDFTIIVATDQAGIGRGDAEFKLLMEWMRLQFEATIAAACHCPNHRNGIVAYRRETPRRRSGAGMLLQAAQNFDLDGARSWMVGDKETDVEAARRAGVSHIVRLNPTAPTMTMLRINDYWLLPNLAAVIAPLHRAQVGT